MINQESKTLREFSISAKAQNGDSIKVFFGYDTGANNSGYYLSVSINGQKQKSDQKTLKRVRALKIDVLNRIIDAIGTDVTGTPYGFDETAESIILTGKIDSIAEYFRISDDQIQSIKDLVSDIKAAKGTSSVSRLVTKFINSQRLRMIELNRVLVQDIRDLYQNGIMLGDTHVVPVFEGLLRSTHNPLYYKRDMDYIRKARVRLFKNVLRRKYRPF